MERAPPNKGMKLTKLSAARFRGRRAASCPRRPGTRAPLRSLSPVFGGLVCECVDADDLACERELSMVILALALGVGGVLS